MKALMVAWSESTLMVPVRFSGPVISNSTVSISTPLVTRLSPMEPVLLGFWLVAD